MDGAAALREQLPAAQVGSRYDRIVNALRAAEMRRGDLQLLLPALYARGDLQQAAKVDAELSAIAVRLTMLTAARAELEAQRHELALGSAEPGGVALSVGGRVSALMEWQNEVVARFEEQSRRLLDQMRATNAAIERALRDAIEPKP